MDLHTLLAKNHIIDAASDQLEYNDVDPKKVVSGIARVGVHELGSLGDCSIGIWEMSPSTTTDVEVDEFFVVLSGEATVRFLDGSPDLHLRNGTVGRLRGGANTIWEVTQTLRKIYIAGPADID